MTGITAHPLPFGGLALVPVSDAGRDWLVRCADNRRHVWGPFTREGAEACLANWRKAWPRNQWEIVKESEA